MCVCMSVFRGEAQHYYGNSSVLKVDVRDLGVYLRICVHYSREKQQ